MATAVNVDFFMTDWETLSLTEEEYDLPVWQKAINTHVVDTRRITVKNDDSENEQELGLNEIIQDRFSDEEDQDADNPVLEENGLNLRKYQHELAAKALQGLNTIICAPTGSGKTRVATYVILEHLKNSNGHKKKKVAFLAQTVPLAQQQYKTLKKHLPNDYKIVIFTGKSKNSMSLGLLLKHSDIFVMTPEILVNNININGLRLNHFSLMVFDECHHTRKSEVYNVLMLKYLMLKHRGAAPSHLPQIVGLTATIGIEKASNDHVAMMRILEVMGNLDCANINTVSDNIEELQRLVAVPDERCNLLRELTPDAFFEKINEIMEELEGYIKHHAKRINDPTLSTVVRAIPPDRRSQRYGQWAVNLKAAARAVPRINSDSAVAMSIRTAISFSKYLADFNFALESYDLVEHTDVINYLSKRFENLYIFEERTEEENILCTHFEELKRIVSLIPDETNPNLRSLSNTLLENLVNNGESSRCIIFVKTRAMAEALSSWINRCNIPALQTLKATYFTGTNASQEQGGMTLASQNDALEMFRSGEVKMLVATSVAEEGIDIPECNLIIKYNYVGNEITTIQTRGRSRQHGGVSILLAMPDVLEREFNNLNKTIIMNQAIKLVVAMEESKRAEFINQHQLQVLELLDQEEKAAPKKVQADYKIICPMCRQLEVDGKHLRTIFKKYRVCIDRELIDGKFIRCAIRDKREMDELEFIGPVYCNSRLPSGKFCRHKLGVMIKHRGAPYFNPGIENVGFFTDVQNPVDSYRQWKKVPYDIKELSTEDIIRYNKLLPEDFNIQLDETDESSSDDE